MTSPDQIHRRLAALGDPETAEFLQGFFKTGPGEYGEGDRFLGVRVPVLRGLVKEYQDLPLAGVAELLRSPFHEERLLALLILVHVYPRQDAGGREAIYRLYLDHTAFINSWDLVDASAAHIVGAHLRGRDRSPLLRLARSQSVWERRIAIIATFHFIRNGEPQETLRVAEVLLRDPHDLIHKGVGWMLREAIKIDREAGEGFLRQHYRGMPRTMLRYAIEKLPQDRRQAYLSGTL